ncbi:MAG TPA: hypothetical protein PLS34_08425 [Gammaproteobacteria bacterium]|nr:hypothetical protein [Gammaproteobacteria bacterium]
MSKFAIAFLFTLTFMLSIAGCSKEPATPAASAPEPAASSTPAQPPHPMPAAPSEAVDLSGIEKADGGKTIAEVFAGKDQLAGQTIVFRGKVVKVNANIMGKNWLHVRDGTGEEGTNDLTVTTADVLPEVGDTVLVTGTVAINKDFGMGYQYAILVEDAEVVVE